MDDVTWTEAFLKDPLTGTTRRMRSSLLGSCVLGVVIAKTGLVPSKIADLGIEFTADHRAALILIALLAVIYFLVAFLVYAMSDFSQWQLGVRSSLLRNAAIDNRALLFEGLGTEVTNLGPGAQDVGLRQAAAQARLDKHMQEAMAKYMRPYWQIAKPLGWIRALLEFVFPVLIGIYTTYLLARLV
jgi:hypothetical protein